MSAAVPSARQAELLEAAYQYAVSRGRADLSLRPLAAAVGSSALVLLYQPRGEGGGTGGPEPGGMAGAAGRIWGWLADDAHRGLLTLWADGYVRSLAEPDGPWAGFAAATVADWLAVLAAAQAAPFRDTPAGAAERTLVLAVLRGALLDLLATGDTARTTGAVRRQLAGLGADRAAGPPA
jgi:hypothetical protein